MVIRSRCMEGLFLSSGEIMKKVTVGFMMSKEK